MGSRWETEDDRREAIHLAEAAARQAETAALPGQLEALHAAEAARTPEERLDRHMRIDQAWTAAFAASAAGDVWALHDALERLDAVQGDRGALQRAISNRIAGGELPRSACTVADVERAVHVIAVAAQLPTLEEGQAHCRAWALGDTASLRRLCRTRGMP